MSSSERLEIIGVTELELLELEEQCSASVMDRPTEERKGAEHGDFGITAAVVVLTAAAIQGLAVWLAKRRVENFSESKVSFEKHPDGSMRLDLSQMARGTVSESPDARVVESLKAQISEFLTPLGGR